MTNKPMLSVELQLTGQQERDLNRFHETCEDSQPYDVSKEGMKSLARIGLVRSLGFSRYEFTDTGDAVIEKLGAPLNKPPHTRQDGYDEAMGEVIALLDKPVAQNQCEPVAKVKPVAKLHAERLTGRDGEYGVTVEDSEWFNTCRLTGGVFSLYAEQPAPVAVVPDGYCIMPRRLTAENWAKALLLGEFTLEVTMDCPECSEMEEPSEGCGICDGEGEYGQKHTISWDQIKFIYSEAVKGLAK